MSAIDQELQSLETYLDGELSVDQVKALETRLATDAYLAATLSQLRQERAARRLVFAALERGDRLSETVGPALRRAALKEKVWSWRLSKLRQVSAAAACLAVGLFVGWTARSQNASSIQLTIPSMNPPANPVAVSRLSHSDNQTAPANPANITLTSDDSSDAPHANGYNVAITDDAGHVLSEQHFDSLKDARDFSSDLSHWQIRPRQTRSGDIRFVGDDF